MNLILGSKDDLASMNIYEHLLLLNSWQKIDDFDNFPVFKSGQYYLVLIKEEKIYAESIDEKIRDSTGLEFENIIVISRHKSASQTKSLTVHPIGNWSVAEAGGKDRSLVKTSPNLMSSSLRLLKKLAKGLDYQVSFEATHHGPYLETPTFFIEIGSTEKEWSDKKVGEVIARNVLEVAEEIFEVGIGVGGGHYVPRITDFVLEKKVSIGHMIPKYAVEKIDEKIFQQAIDKTPNCSFVYIHKKGLSSEERNKIKKIADELGLPIKKSDDFYDYL